MDVVILVNIKRLVMLCNNMLCCYVFRFDSCLAQKSGIIRDTTMDDKLLYSTTPNYDEQNYLFYIMKLYVEKFGDTEGLYNPIKIKVYKVNKRETVM